MIYRIPASKRKGGENKKKKTRANCKTFTKGTHGKRNELDFPKQVFIQIPKVLTAAISLHIFLYLLFHYKTKQKERKRKMGSCYSIQNHIRNAALSRDIYTSVDGGGCIN